MAACASCGKEIESGGIRLTWNSISNCLAGGDSTSLTMGNLIQLPTLIRKCLKSTMEAPEVFGGGVAP